MREDRPFEFLDPAGMFVQLHLDDGVEPTHHLGKAYIHFTL